MKSETMNEKFKNLPVKKKLTYSFGIIILTTFVLIAALLIGMKIIEERLNRLYEGPTMNISYSAELYYPQLDIQRAVNRLFADGVDHIEEMYPQLESTMNKNLAVMEEARAFLRENLLTKEDKEKLQAIEGTLENVVRKHREEVLRLAKAGDYDGAMEYNNTYYKTAVDEVKVMIEDLNASILNTAEEYKNTSEMISNALLLAGIVLVIIIIYISIKLSVRVTNSIVEPLIEIEAAARQLREGDLSHGDDIRYESEDELGTLAKSLKEAINFLDEYVKNICENFATVAQGDLTRDVNDIPDYLGDFVSLKENFGIIFK